MVQQLMAQKKGMRQVWTVAGKRLPVTQLMVGGNVVMRADVSGEAPVYHVAFGDKKLANTNNAQGSVLSKLGLKTGKRRFFPTTAEAELQAGQELKVEEVFQVGDRIKVTGITKGLGFAGAMKRWGFSGGPATHGQSDRARAVGSIGAGTTPGHVWKGKKMPGRGGNKKQTLETVEIVAVNPGDQSIWVKGTLPGAIDSLLTVRKNGVTKAQELNLESRRELGIVEPTVVVEEAQAEQVTQEATV
jgi:large subunit ribosomal protein L3